MTPAVLRRCVTAVVIAIVVAVPSVSATTTVVVTHNVNLRPDPSSEYPPIRLLTPAEPPLTLLDPMPESGYYHVSSSAGEEGYVWTKYVHVSTGTTVGPTPTTTNIVLGAGVPGSDGMV